MARKNLLTGLTERKLTAGNSDEAAAPRAPSPAFSSRGAFGAVSRTIDDLAARADAARALEARLATGAVVVELDPATIDRSFIPDRMETDDESYRSLRASIAATGQASPILVRPHPSDPGRYQVAFGHRRLRAAADLGRPARCIVKPLSDRELVIAQGQENSARADLSFIERGRFAHALEEAGYDRETIMQALSIDKTTLSRLVAVASRLPTDIVDAVGPAPSAGRDRWMLLATVYAERAVARPVDPLLESPEFLAAVSDARFEMGRRGSGPGGPVAGHAASLARAERGAGGDGRGGRAGLRADDRQGGGEGFRRIPAGADGVALRGICRGAVQAAEAARLPAFAPALTPVRGRRPQAVGAGEEMADGGGVPAGAAARGPLPHGLELRRDLLQRMRGCGGPDMGDQPHEPIRGRRPGRALHQPRLEDSFIDETADGAAQPLDRPGFGWAAIEDPHHIAPGLVGPHRAYGWQPAVEPRQDGVEMPRIAARPQPGDRRRVTGDEAGIAADAAAAPGGGETRAGALGDQRAFELGDRPQHLQRKHALRAGGIDGIAQAAEPRAGGLERRDDGEEMAHRAGEAVEPHDHQGIAGPDVAEQAGEHGPAAIGARGLFDEDRVAARGAERVALRIGALLLGGDAGIADEAVSRRHGDFFTMKDSAWKRPFASVARTAGLRHTSPGVADCRQTALTPPDDRVPASSASLPTYPFRDVQGSKERVAMVAAAGRVKSQDWRARKGRACAAQLAEARAKLMVLIGQETY